MSRGKSFYHTAKTFARVALLGAGFGVLMVLWGTLWEKGTDTRELVLEGAAGAVGGAMVGLVLHLTRSYRTRGDLQYYNAWMLAGALGALVIATPSLLREGWTTVVIALILGVPSGLGLGVFARQVSSGRD